MTDRTTDQHAELNRVFQSVAWDFDGVSDADLIARQKELSAIGGQVPAAITRIGAELSRRRKPIVKDAAIVPVQFRVHEPHLWSRQGRA